MRTVCLAGKPLKQEFPPFFFGQAWCALHFPKISFVGPGGALRGKVVQGMKKALLIIVGTALMLILLFYLAVLVTGWL
jgi:hypothetical protein